MQTVWPYFENADRRWESEMVKTDKNIQTHIQYRLEFHSGHLMLSDHLLILQQYKTLSTYNNIIINDEMI